MASSRADRAGAVPVPPVAERRGFVFPWPRGRNAIAPAILLLAACVTANDLAAQRPGDVVGIVLDAVSGAPVDGVEITLPDAQRATSTDAAGRFTLRGVDAGTHHLHMARLGYAARDVSVDVRNGATARVSVRLAPAPVSLEGIEAGVAADRLHLDREDLVRSGARTAGDALRAVPGIVVRSTGPGSPQLVSVRGMAPDAVLVLVDGVPLNDAVTGEADLSAVSAASIASITVEPGGRSSRWGARAAAGVIRIETLRGGEAERALHGGTGSLGAWDAGASWGGGTDVLWSAGADVRSMGGAFDFDLPAAIGGGARRRANADVRSIDTHAALGTRLAGGRLDARIGYDALRRGLPGRGFAPSPHARQATRRGRASLGWRRTGDASALTLLVAASGQHLESADPEPPLGLPWGDTTQATFVETRVEGERLVSGATVGVGGEVRYRHIGGTILEDDAPATQVDAGAFAHADVPLAALRLSAEGRIDRDPRGGAFASHALTLSWSPGAVALHVAHRSSYSPPTAGDLYFRDAVGVAPNPDLEAERVPGEVEAGVRVQGGVGGWSGGLHAAAYRGDVRGMILWAPDYRFLWSPYNQDARRLGLDVSAELRSPGRAAMLSATWNAVRVTYDRGEDDDDVQIAYRPRYSGSIRGDLAAGRTRLDAAVRYTGERTTAPTALNTLPGFWTMDAGVTHELRLGAWSLGLELHIDRLFDNDAALIFGFPEPGRVFRLGVRLAPRSSSTLLSLGAQ